MSWRPRVLLVTQTPAHGKHFFDWLIAGGYDVTLVVTFAAAKVHLVSSPDLLISEIRLGEYNGLHLASRAQAAHIPAIVIGDADPVLERDARQMQIVYLHEDLDRESLLVSCERLLRERARQAGDGTVTGAGLAFVSSADLGSMRPQPRKARW